MFTVADLFDLSQTEHAALLEGDSPAWEALPRISDYLAANLLPANHASVSPNAEIGENVFLGEGTMVDLKDWEPESFEAAIKRHPKVVIRFAG